MTDHVSSIQTQLKVLCGMLGQSVGILQRDAVPLSVTGEDAADAGTSINVEAEAETWSKNILAASRELDRLVDLLPPSTSTATEEEEALVALRRSIAVVDKVIKQRADAVRAQATHLDEGLHAIVMRQVGGKKGT